MAKWPDKPVYTPLSDINKGNEYVPADGIIADDINAIIKNIGYLYENGGGGKGNLPLESGDKTVGSVETSVDTYKGIPEGFSYVPRGQGESGRITPKEGDEIPGSKVTGAYAYAYGLLNEVYANYAVAFGYKNTIEESGIESIVGGYNNQAFAAATLLVGTNNVVNKDATSSITGGNNNENNSVCSVIVGTENTTTAGAWSSINSGTKNTNRASKSIIAGESNQNNSPNGVMVGEGLKSGNTRNQLNFGMFNAPRGDCYAVYGVGSSDADRKNLTELRTDGRLKLRGVETQWAPLTDPEDVVTKHFHDQKRDLVAAGSNVRVYTVATDGTQSYYEATTDPIANTVALRSPEGRLKTQKSAEALDCVNRYELSNRLRDYLTEVIHQAPYQYSAKRKAISYNSLTGVDATYQEYWETIGGVWYEPTVYKRYPFIKGYGIDFELDTTNYTAAITVIPTIVELSSDPQATASNLYGPVTDDQLSTLQNHTDARIKVLDDYYSFSSNQSTLNTLVYNCSTNITGYYYQKCIKINTTDKTWSQTSLSDKELRVTPNVPITSSTTELKSLQIGDNKYKIPEGGSDGELSFQLATLATKDPTKTHIVWKGKNYPDDRILGGLILPKGAIVQWGDGKATVISVTTDNTTHEYTDDEDYHIITITGLTKLNDSAFYSCDNIIKIHIGNSITENMNPDDGNEAFFGCNNLNEVTGLSMRAVGTNMFAQCKALKQITIDDDNQSTVSIGPGAFSGCTKLEKVIIDAVDLSTINAAAFSNCTKLKYVIFKKPEGNAPNLPDPTYVFPSYTRIVVTKDMYSKYYNSSAWNIYKNQICYNLFNNDLSDALEGILPLESGEGVGSAQTVSSTYRGQPSGFSYINAAGNTVTPKNGDTVPGSIAAGAFAAALGLLNNVEADYGLAAGHHNNMYASAKGSIMCGYNNKLYATGAFVIGQNNTINSSAVYALTIGSDNTNNASVNILGGSSNTTTGAGWGAIIAGNLNLVRAPKSITAGIANINDSANGLMTGESLRSGSSENQVNFGKYNSPRGDCLLTWGNGDDDNSRKNIVEIRSDGRLKLKGDIAPVDPEDALRKKDVVLYKHALYFEYVLNIPGLSKIYARFVANEYNTSSEELTSTTIMGTLSTRTIVTGLLKIKDVAYTPLFVNNNFIYYLGSDDSIEQEAWSITENFIMTDTVSKII